MEKTVYCSREAKCHFCQDGGRGRPYSHLVARLSMEGTCTDEDTCHFCTHTVRDVKDWSGQRAVGCPALKTVYVQEQRPTVQAARGDLL